jgi:magnesium chelatase family protein
VALFRTRSAAIFGIDAHPVEVEVDMYPGGSQRDFVVVGMPDLAVRESRDRIRSALSNSGFGYPAKAVTINLAPANVRKEGAGFDLPMATAVLGAMGSVKPCSEMLLAGELSLDGGLRPVRGVLSMAVCARKNGLRALVVPKENAAEAAVVEGLQVYGVTHLNEVALLLNCPERCAPVVPQSPGFPLDGAGETPDYADVRGQNSAKRALEVAAAGSHNVLMVGPPGSGKTMLARRLPGILPPMSFDEALATSQVHSVAGVLPPGQGLLRERPFRAPHHSVSEAGLIGGGVGMPHAGEVSLAHHGVLFLDELTEFSRVALEMLRQPLEDHSVTIARSQMSLTFPADFMLVGAMNPCPCGYFGDPTHDCRCTGAIIQRYLGKISGPLLDRIDIHVEVPAVAYQELHGRSTGTPSAVMRERVRAARALQSARGYVNTSIPPGKLRELCPLDAGAERALEMAVQRLSLSARAHDRILKVARTIADLASCEVMQAKHIAEAVQYRSLDREYWK